MKEQYIGGQSNFALKKNNNFPISTIVWTRSLHTNTHMQSITSLPHHFSWRKDQSSHYHITFIYLYSWLILPLKGRGQDTAFRAQVDFTLPIPSVPCQNIYLFIYQAAIPPKIRAQSQTVCAEMVPKSVLLNSTFMTSSHYTVFVRQSVQLCGRTLKSSSQD